MKRSQPAWLAVSLLLVVLALIAPEHAGHARRFNILHVTDLHGWVFGHPHTPELDADFGDFTSLVEHMKTNAAANDEEFFLFDSGDLIEGTGMSDATDIHGEYIFPIVQMVHGYTALTMGNHDIGHNNVIEFMQKNFIPFWGDGYITDNSLIKQTGKMIGAPYKLLRTALGTNVLVLGYLFNFTQPAPIAEVTTVSQSLLEQYFQDAMKIKDVDMIVVVAHIDPTTPPELSQIYAAIRKAHPTTPLVILSGHRHITYFSWLDNNAFTLESGKYFEVVGHMRFDVNQNHQINQFNYEWVNTSRTNFYSLAKRSSQNFLTPRGRAVKEFIRTTFNKLQLNDTLGCFPKTLSPDVGYRDPNSLFYFWINTIVPQVVFNNSVGLPTFFITNDASLRYDLYEGRVTPNDIYTVLPFKDAFYYVTVTGDQLTAAIAYLNKKKSALVDGGRVRYHRHNKPHGARDITDSFYYSDVQIQSSQKYAVLVEEYDGVALGVALRALYPSHTWTFTPYPTSLSSTSALSAYIQRFQPCRPSCAC